MSDNIKSQGHTPGTALPPPTPNYLEHINERIKGLVSVMNIPLVRSLDSRTRDGFILSEDETTTHCHFFHTFQEINEGVSHVPLARELALNNPSGAAIFFVAAHIGFLDGWQAAKKASKPPPLIRVIH